MASLADELLSDLQDEASQPTEKTQLADTTTGPAPVQDIGTSSLASALDLELDEASATHDAHGASTPPEAMDTEQVNAMDMRAQNVESARSVSKLHGNPALEELLQSIDKHTAQPLPPVAGALESTGEYQLILRANNMAVEVDNEILVLHKFIRQRYAPRFPELETLVLDPWDFIRAVRALGNGQTLERKGLEGIVPAGTIVVISMTASTTTGKPLPAVEWSRILEACDMVQYLEETRHKILSYVESRMTLLAPNLSALVGTRVATKMVGVAGGLAAFAKIPACNVHLLGASKKQDLGLSSIHGNDTRYSGYLAQCDLVMQTPEDYRKQALRMVAAKASLAARMDVGGSSSTRSGHYGSSLHEEIARKIDKLMEPPPAKLVKALPVPSEGGRKQRRGGRRARKFREMYGQTELQKMQNRVEFGKEEAEAGAFDETVGLGMIGSQATGKIRAAMASASSKARMSKANKERLATLNRPTLSLQSTTPGMASTSGTASSLSFTPVQGIELVDPSRQKKVDEANSKWFREGQFSLVPQDTKTSMLPPPPPSRSQT